MITIQKFRWFLNYHSVYSCEGYNERPMHSEICFASVFNSGNNDKIIENTYQIKIYKPCANQLLKNNSNCCYLSKTDLMNYLTSCKIWHSTGAKQHKIKLDEYNDHYIVTININDYKTVHRFILTYIRFTYEFPFSLYLYEAYKLREDKNFAHEYILNLFHLVHASTKTDIDYCWAHTFIKSMRGTNVLYISDLRQVQKEFKKHDNVYFEQLLRHSFGYLSTLKENNIYNLRSSTEVLKYFKSKKEREERIKQYYLPNYKKILNKFYNGKNN